MSSIIKECNDSIQGNNNVLLCGLLRPGEGFRPLFVKLLQKAFNDPLKANHQEELSPLLVRMHLNKIERIKEKAAKDYRIYIRNLEGAYSFLNNSSIWLRLADIDDKIAEKELDWFVNLGLYNYKPAKEYIKYQIRAIKENYLDDLTDSTGSGHGTHVTPTIFSNEVEFRDFFISDNNSKDSHFKFLPGSDNRDCFTTKNVSLRILLVDDKIACTDENNQKSDDGLIKRDYTLSLCSCDCSECANNKECNSKKCKLRILRELISGNFIPEKAQASGDSAFYRTAFQDNTYWAENVQSYHFASIKGYDKGTGLFEPDLRISDIWVKDKCGTLRPKKKNKNETVISCLSRILRVAKEIGQDEKEKEKPTVQIVAVRDLESALALMSFCKFDIILLDYLLGTNLDKSGRSYSTELFEFLSYEFSGKDKKGKRKEEPEIVTSLLASTGFDEPRLGKFQEMVKLFRGPLDKFWIIPMTSYNSSFISDLQSKHVRLIDHRWNISQGADPINTPWKFLYKINEFVDLQLRLSVYTQQQLLTFIRVTGTDYRDRYKDRYLNQEKVNKTSCFVDFQQFMGSEYANFTKRYGAQKMIERDAEPYTNENHDKIISVEQSLFAKYVNDNFYINYKQFGTTTELNRLMHEFYHQAATMFDDRFGRQRLREAFERLRVYIAYNKLVDWLKDDETKEVKNSMQFLRAVIDGEFEIKKINKYLK